MEPLKIVLVSTSLMRGGAETQVYLLARKFAQLGHEVLVVSLRDPDAFGPELAEAGIPVVSLSMRRGVPDPTALARLVRLLRAERPHVVHAHMVHANLIARAARLFARVPVLVSTAHSMIEGGRWVDLAYRLTDGLGSVTTNVCVAGVERYVEAGAAPRAKMRYVPNGLDGAPFERDPQARARLREELALDGRFVWLAVGALEDVKDYPLMLRSVRAAAAGGPPMTLLIASEGSLRSELEAERDALGLTPRDVKFLGLRTDVAQLMSAADGFLMTSKWEGLPMVLLEASMAQLPLVSTRAGGAEEIVVPGTGILVDSREPDAVAQAMRSIMSLEPAERLALGRRARQHVIQNFSLDEVAARWTELYRSYLGAEA